GSFAISYGLERVTGAAVGSGAAQAAFAFAAAAVALGASVCHLGRPHLAFRAVLGLGHSWLSREAIGFAAYTKLCALYALARAVDWFPGLPFGALLASLAPALGAVTALLGVGSVFCSVM